MAGIMTAQQIAFAEAFASGKTAADAYRIAGYNCDGLTSAQLIQRGNSVLRGRAVSEYLAQLRSETANVGAWTREQVLTELQVLYHDAKSAITAQDDGGNAVPGTYNHQAAGVALKCIDAVSRMCGFDAPQQVENTVTVQFSSDIAKYGK